MAYHISCISDTLYYHNKNIFCANSDILYPICKIYDKLYTGCSCYVDFACLDTTTYVEVIFHSQHFFLYFFAFQLCLCRKRLT